MLRLTMASLMLSLVVSDDGLHPAPPTASGTSAKAGVAAATSGARGLFDSSYVSTSRVAGGFALAENGRVATFVVSAADYSGVRRAVSDLRGDVERVTGVAPRVAISDSAG